jgi:hypothetical protein
MATVISRQEEVAEKRRYWKEHLDSWQVSGLTQVEYCRKNDLSRFRFQYWKRRFQPSASLPSFIELPLSAVVGQKPYQALRLVVGNHYQIAVERDFDPMALKQLIGVLDRL